MKEEKVKFRGIRLSAEEEALVKEFLDKNPFFDFSSLTRVALKQFIKKPELKIWPVGHPKKDGAQNEIGR